MAFINSLYNLWPNGDERMPSLRDGIAISALTVFPKYGINTPLLIAHVMAQISHECGAGHDLIENLNYSAARIRQVWPSRFATVEAAAPYANNPQKLANKVYNGRLGNRAGSNDGWNFRGRGGSQTTGRDGYKRVAAQTGLDVVNKPDLLIDPHYFLRCAVSDFINCGCLPYAQQDNVGAVSAALNVGDPKAVSKVIGLTERQAWLDRWKKANVKDFSLPAALTKISAA
jgi:putative chitinase